MYKQPRQRLNNRAQPAQNDFPPPSEDVGPGSYGSKRRPFVFRRTAPLRPHHSDSRHAPQNDTSKPFRHGKHATLTDHPPNVPKSSRKSQSVIERRLVEDVPGGRWPRDAVMPPLPPVPPTDCSVSQVPYYMRLNKTVPSTTDGPPSPNRSLPAAPAQSDSLHQPLAKPVNESNILAADKVKRALKLEVSKRLQEANMADGKVNICMLTCDGNLADVSYVPCGHRLICSRCAVSARPKRCQVCHRAIEGAKDLCGKPAPLGSLKTDGEGRSNAELDQLRELLEELEISSQCQICMDAEANTVFQCGHRACPACSDPLEDCHMCREKIRQRQRIFLG